MSTAIYRSEAGAEAIEQRYQELSERWPVPAEHLIIPTRHGETFVLAFGPADAPPVLALQGSGGNAAMWLPQVTELAKRHRIYAVDVIGEPGLSSPTRPELGSGEYALWLDDVAGGLGLTRSAVLGVSLGGWLAIDYATRRPERVSKLAVLTPAGVGKRRMGVLVKLIALSLLGKWGRRKSLNAAVGPHSRLTEWSESVGEFVLLIFKHFKPHVRVPTFDDDTLRRLTMPVLVVAGGRDPMVDSADTARRFELVLPHASVHFVAEAGHDLSDQTAKVVEFL